MLGLNSIRSGGAANDDVDAIDLVQASGSDIAGDNIDDPAAFDRDDDGGGKSAVGIGDAIAAVTWIGTSSGGPPNGSGRQYNIDNNANGISDAPSTTDAEHDRRATVAKKCAQWRGVDCRRTTCGQVDWRSLLVRVVSQGGRVMPAAKKTA